jgi:hypothetical protein
MMSLLMHVLFQAVISKTMETPWFSVDHGENYKSDVPD